MIIKNFKNSRENIDIKQKDIAEFFNLNFTTISGWETGKDTIVNVNKEMYKILNLVMYNFVHY